MHPDARRLGAPGPPPRMPASGPQLPQHLARSQPRGVSRLLLCLAGCQAPEAVAALPSPGHCLLCRVWQEHALGESAIGVPRLRKKTSGSP